MKLTAALLVDVWGTILLLLWDSRGSCLFVKKDPSTFSSQLWSELSWAVTHKRSRQWGCLCYTVRTWWRWFSPPFLLCTEDDWSPNDLGRGSSVFWSVKTSHWGKIVNNWHSSGRKWTALDWELAEIALARLCKDHLPVDFWAQTQAVTLSK